MTEPFVGGEGELGVPVFAEMADERLAQEFVDADSFFSAQNLGTFADFPAVIVDGCYLPNLF